MDVPNTAQRHQDTSLSSPLDQARVASQAEADDSHDTHERHLETSPATVDHSNPPVSLTQAPQQSTPRDERDVSGCNSPRARALRHQDELKPAVHAHVSAFGPDGSVSQVVSPAGDIDSKLNSLPDTSPSDRPAPNPPQPEIAHSHHDSATIDAHPYVRERSTSRSTERNPHEATSHFDTVPPRSHSAALPDDASTHDASHQRPHVGSSHDDVPVAHDRDLRSLKGDSSECRSSTARIRGPRDSVTRESQEISTADGTIASHSLMHMHQQATYATSATTATQHAGLPPRPARPSSSSVHLHTSEASTGAHPNVSMPMSSGVAGVTTSSSGPPKKDMSGKSSSKSRPSSIPDPTHINVSSARGIGVHESHHRGHASGTLSRDRDDYAETVNGGSVLNTVLSHAEGSAGGDQDSNLASARDDTSYSVHQTQFGVSVDGIEYRRREHLMPAKASRLAAESLEPIENLTFARIANCSRDQLRSYCSVYGLRRQNKPIMEQSLARAAAAFHPGDPDYDLSNFNPSSGPVLQVRRKRSSTDTEGHVPSQSPSQSPSPVPSTVPSPLVGFRTTNPFQAPNMVGAGGVTPNSVSSVPGAAHLTPGGGAYHMRPPSAMSPVHKRPRIHSADGATTSDLLASARMDGPPPGAPPGMFAHPDKPSDAPGTGQCAPGMADAGGANFFGPGQLLAPPSTMYDGGHRFPSHGAVGVPHDHPGVPPGPGPMPGQVGDVPGVTGGEMGGPGGGELVTRQAAVAMFNDAVQVARQSVRGEISALWTEIQEQRAQISKMQATLNSFAGQQ